MEIVKSFSCVSKNQSYHIVFLVEMFGVLLLFYFREIINYLDFSNPSEK